MVFCISSGDSCRSAAMEGREVFRIVESSICMNIAVASMKGRILLVGVSKIFEESGIEMYHQKMNLNSCGMVLSIPFPIDQKKPAIFGRFDF